jgi:hypothetical protein
MTTSDRPPPVYPLRVRTDRSRPSRASYATVAAASRRCSVRGDRSNRRRSRTQTGLDRSIGRSRLLRPRRRDPPRLSRRWARRWRRSRASQG